MAPVWRRQAASVVVAIAAGPPGVRRDFGLNRDGRLDYTPPLSGWPQGGAPLRPEGTVAAYSPAPAEMPDAAETLGQRLRQGGLIVALALTLNLAGNAR